VADEKCHRDGSDERTSQDKNALRIHEVGSFVPIATRNPLEIA